MGGVPFIYDKINITCIMFNFNTILEILNVVGIVLGRNNEEKIVFIGDW